MALAAEGAAVAVAARRVDRLEELATVDPGRRRHGAGPGDRPDRPGAGAGGGRADGQRARPAGHAGQQRRRHAARPDRRRAGRGVGPDGRAQPAGPALRHARRAAAPAAGGRGLPAPGRRRGQHQLDGRPVRPAGHRGLQRHQVRRERVHRVAAPGGAQAARAGQRRRAGSGHHRAQLARAARGLGAGQPRASPGIERLQAPDIADAVSWIVTRDRRWPSRRSWSGRPNRTSSRFTRRTAWRSSAPAVIGP